MGRVSSEMCMASLSQGTDADFWGLGSTENQVGLEGHREGKIGRKIGKKIGRKLKKIKSGPIETH